MNFTTYNRDEIKPGILHFGVGGFHRAHQANYLNQLMSQGEAKEWGLCGVGVLPGDAKMKEALEENDGLYTLVIKNPDGTAEAETIGSIVDYVFAPEDPAGLLERLTDPAARIVSLTVTEGGYNIDDATGKFKADNPAAVRYGETPREPQTAFGYITEGLRLRKEAGVPPFTVMSCDNLPGNGDVARTALVGQAKLSDPEFADWIESSVAFPNSMVDRITPVTSPEDIALAESLTGEAEPWPVVCEPFTQWVLEDNFTLGRPEFEKVGVQIVQDVRPYELMKLRLLNASHQALAHWGRLLGHTYAHEAATDPDLAEFVRKFLNQEARATLEAVSGIDVDEYVDTLFERFANPAIQDTLARLATDASERMPKFVLPTAWDLSAAGTAAPMAAAICAAWTKGMEESQDLGVALEVSDRSWDQFAGLVKEGREAGNSKFLDYQAIFGELGGNPTFASAFDSVLQDLRSRNAREVLRELNTKS